MSRHLCAAISFISQGQRSKVKDQGQICPS